MSNPHSDHDWVELYCLNDGNHGKGIDVAGFMITDLDGEDTIFNNTDSIILQTGDYAVVHWKEGTDETPEKGDINQNGYIDIFIDDYGLTATDDQVALINETGSIIDAACWANQDETWSTNNINDVQTLKDQGAWTTFADTPVQSDCINSSQNIYSKGYSIGRTSVAFDNNSKQDFKLFETPTPGKNNYHMYPKPSFTLEMMPSFIPKIATTTQHSIPFAVKPQLSNFTPSENYQLKAYVTGNISSSIPATQTWNGSMWKYSNYYTINIKTDQHGNWSDWLYLRFKREYVEYPRNIQHGSKAYLKIKYRNASASQEITTPISLLNMDNTSCNGTSGGYILGRAKKNNVFLQNKLIIIENKTGNITSIYRVENNSINEELPSLPGYYKIPTPVGYPYTLRIVDQNLTTLYQIQNITVKQGEYKATVNLSKKSYLVEYNQTKSIPIRVANTGDFNDTITLHLNNTSNKWNVDTETNHLYLQHGEEKTFSLHIKPKEDTSLSDILHLNLSCTSTGDPGITDKAYISIQLHAPDLHIRQATAYDHEKQERTRVGQGEIIRLKATVKNQGNKIASKFNVSFMLSANNQEIKLGEKHYESIGVYPKYPSLIYDTTRLSPGDHTVTISVDNYNQIEEANEENNMFSFPLHIIDTTPSTSEQKLLITEVYYFAHPNINNEFITIVNPTSEAVDISGWYLTDHPSEISTNQPKILFPPGTILPSNSSITVTQNATAFSWETGKPPLFEYHVNSSSVVPQMRTYKTMVLNNEGEILVLKTPYNHTIDTLIYGDSFATDESWSGPSVKGSGMGVILKRRWINSHPVDTNSSLDWMHPRIYGIGQSDFSACSIVFKGNITSFVSPDSTYESICKELHRVENSVFLNMYEFTSPPLCRELRDLLKRDVTVNILMEGSPVGGVKDEEFFILNELTKAGAEVHMLINDRENNIFSRYPFTHAKYAIIDNTTLILHTANWAKTGVPTNNTFGNREWGIIIHNTTVADYFTEVFFEDWTLEKPDVRLFEECEYNIPDDFLLDESIPSGSYTPTFPSKSTSGIFTATPVLSPDTSENTICSFLDSAEHHIYVEQLYIHKKWDTQTNPFLQRLVNQSRQGITVRVILNCNPDYTSTQQQNVLTKKYLQQNGINVKFIYTNSSCFTNVHTKGIIIDNESVLISSINWNENSVRKNRESGIIIENREAATYYANVFLHDWNYKPEEHLSRPTYDYFPSNTSEASGSLTEYKNQVCIVAIFTLTIFIIALDWRKRTW